MAPHVVYSQQPEDTTFRLEPITNQIKPVTVLLNDGTPVYPVFFIESPSRASPPRDKFGHQTTYTFRNKLWTIQTPVHTSSWNLHQPTIHHPTNSHYALYKYGTVNLQPGSASGVDQWAWVKALSSHKAPIEAPTDRTSELLGTGFLMAEPKKSTRARANNLGTTQAAEPPHAIQMDVAVPEMVFTTEMAANADGQAQTGDRDGDVAMSDVPTADGEVTIAAVPLSPEETARMEALVNVDVTIADVTKQQLRVVVNGGPATPAIERNATNLNAIDAPSGSGVAATTTEVSVAPQNDDAALTASAATEVRNDGPPPRKKKASDYYGRTALWPHKAAHFGKRLANLDDLPYELRAMICSYVGLETLVALGGVNRNLRVFCRSTWSNTMFRTARETYKVPLHRLDPAVDPGWGCSRTEFDWANYALGGGWCAFCGVWTDVSRVCYSLSVHVCLMQECRSHWRKECKKHEPLLISQNTASPTQAPQFSGSTAIDDYASIIDEILDLHEQDQENQLAALASGSNLSALHPLAEPIKRHPALHVYLISNNHLPVLLQRPPDEQPIVLGSLLAALPAGHGLFKQAEALQRAAVLKLRKTRGAGRKPSLFPPFLCELGSVAWPSEELKGYVQRGMVFVECSPHVKRGYYDDDKGLSRYYRRKYKLSDVEAAVQEWTESELNGTRADLIKHWERRAKYLQDSMMAAHTLMRWRDDCKKTLGTVRTKNDRFLREHIAALGLPWHDAANSPTLVSVRNTSELGMEALSETTWEEHSATIKKETLLLLQRRLAREKEANLKVERSVIEALYRYCDAQGLGPLPPLRIFHLLPTPKACAATAPNADGNFSFWLPQVKEDVEAWREAVKVQLRSRVLGGEAYPDPTKARVKALDEVLDWSTSLFLCDTCDDRAEKIARDANAASKLTRGNNKKPRDIKPIYLPPMTWEGVIKHKCINWDLNAFSRHKGAQDIAAEACRTMGCEPRMTKKQDLVDAGARWMCEEQGCGKALNWEDMVAHLEHHKAAVHYSCDALDLISRNRQLPLAGQTASTLPHDICVRLKNAPLHIRLATSVQCALCHPDGKPDKQQWKKFNFDGFRDHLMQSHKGKRIERQDMIVLVNGLDVTSAGAASFTAPPSGTKALRGRR